MLATATTEQELAERIATAHADKTPLRLRGGGTKLPLLQPAAGASTTPAEVLDVGGYAGVVNLEPSELVVTVRAGTRLRALNAALAQVGQRLAFEPAEFNGDATVGGVVAMGLAGPRRTASGGVRDAILGAKIVNGLGQSLSFGGQVMKNVAGYDVSRLQAGALGTLGVLLEVSLRTWPVPECEQSIRLDLANDAALAKVVALARTPLPIDATAAADGALWLRLAGTELGVAAARAQLGGETIPAAATPWAALRDYQHPGMRADPARQRSPWCLHVAPSAPFPDLPGTWLTEWSGARRWFSPRIEQAEDAEVLWSRIGQFAASCGGWARRSAWQPAPLSPTLMPLHQRLRTAFDPHGVLNPDLGWEAAEPPAT